MPIERAARLALPMPVSEAERVSIPARKTDERDESRTRRMRISLSDFARAG